jgi:hypothetical protein
MLILIGAFVLGLLIVVYSSRMLARAKPVPVTLEQVASTADPNLGIAQDLEPLGAEDAPELQEPALAETLAAVSDAVSDRQAELDDVAIDGDPHSSRGSGQGDARQAGSGGEGVVERVPRAQRWEIRFVGGNLEAYARQLDFFGIELAVLSTADNAVHYASNLAQAKPEHTTKSPELEDRLYMSWRGGPLQQADRQLLEKAGITIGKGVILQFYPAAVEADLALKEKAFAKGRDVNEIRKTIYGVQQDGDTYAFFVIDQKYF